MTRSLLPSLALVAALVAPAVFVSQLPARADDKPAAAEGEVEVPFTVTLEKGSLSVRILHPKGEELWAKVVKAHLERGLPAIAKAAGFGPGKEHLDVRFAATASETGGYEAALTPEALLVRKTGARKGVHGFWILNAAARMWTEQVAKSEWLKGGLTHLLVHHALKSAPLVYEPRAYRDEVLEERLKVTDEAPLDQWTPAPPGGGPVEEQAVALPQVALAFGYLYDIDRRLEGKLVQAAAAVALGEKDVEKGPLATKDFVAAVSKIAGADATEYFTGWAIAPKEGGPTPKLDKTDLMDSDLDGLLNFEEDLEGTDKAKADTDGDKVPDGEEVEDGSNAKEKDAKRGKVRLDGDPKEWLKLKKFSMQDQEGDAKKDGDKIIAGGDLKFVKVACDEKYLYVMLEVTDGFTNPDCVYTIAIDTADDGVPLDSKKPEEQRKVVWNYLVGFRTDNPRPWIQVTHNQKDYSWAEMRNHWRLGLAVKENHAELRIPLAPFEIPDKILLMTYVKAKDGALSVDSAQREVFDLAKWRD